MTDYVNEQYSSAKKIMKLLGVKKNDPSVLMGIMAACADCDNMGPKNGRPCMCLKLCREMGCEYIPPDWCKDTKGR